MLVDNQLHKVIFLEVLRFEGLLKHGFELSVEFLGFWLGGMLEERNFVPHLLLGQCSS